MTDAAHDISTGAARASGGLCDGRSAIRGWRCGSVALELHAGMPTILPKHAHDAYQIGLTTRDPGEYLCEGRMWHAPPGSVILFHPGDVHCAAQIGVRSRHETSRLMFVVPQQMRQIAASLDGRDRGQPVFDDLVIRDAAFIQRFAEIHALAGGDADPLEKESRLLSLLGWLVGRFSTRPVMQAPLARNRRKALLVRDFIESHYRDTISMAQLAEVAHTSPYHLNRLFAREIGIPPHAYQTQLRIERAKWLLLRGTSVTDAALSMGFFDQSHFTRYFKRIVGVPPRSYALLAA